MKKTKQAMRKKYKKNTKSKKIEKPTKKQIQQQ